MFRAWGDKNSWNMNLDIEPEPGQDGCTFLIVRLRKMNERNLERLYRMVLKNDG